MKQFQSFPYAAMNIPPETQQLIICKKTSLHLESCSKNHCLHCGACSDDTLLWTTKGITSIVALNVGTIYYDKPKRPCCWDCDSRLTSKQYYKSEQQ